MTMDRAPRDYVETGIRPRRVRRARNLLLALIFINPALSLAALALCLLRG